MLKKIDLKDPAPLYEQIENDIKTRIHNGEYKVGDQIASQNEMAKEYDVSLITVKKALTNLIGQGVLFGRVGKGTYIASQPAQIDLQKHKTIGVVLRNLEHPFFSKVIEAAEREAYTQDYHFLISSSSGNREKEETQIKRFRSIGVSGLIIASLSLVYTATKILRKIHDEEFPYITVSYMHDPDIWFVGADNELGGYLAGKHLVECGYKKIGYIHGGRGNILGDVRKNGFWRALDEGGVEVHSNYVYYLEDEPIRYESGYKMGKRFVKLKDRPEALFIYTDSAALGFLKAVTEKGMKVPDDVAIVGYNDIDAARMAPVPLTTISQPVEEIGKKAVIALIQRIHKIEQPNRYIFKPELVVRESTAIRKTVLRKLI